MLGVLGALEEVAFATRQSLEEEVEHLFRQAARVDTRLAPELDVRLLEQRLFVGPRELTAYCIDDGRSIGVRATLGAEGERRYP